MSYIAFQCAKCEAEEYSFSGNCVRCGNCGTEYSIDSIFNSLIENEREATLQLIGQLIDNRRSLGCDYLKQCYDYINPLDLERLSAVVEEMLKGETEEWLSCFMAGATLSWKSAELTEITYKKVVQGVTLAIQKVPREFEDIVFSISAALLERTNLSVLLQKLSAFTQTPEANGLIEYTEFKSKCIHNILTLNHINFLKESHIAPALEIWDEVVEEFRNNDNSDDTFPNKLLEYAEVKASELIWTKASEALDELENQEVSIGVLLHIFSELLLATMMIPHGSVDLTEEQIAELSDYRLNKQMAGQYMLIDLLEHLSCMFDAVEITEDDAFENMREATTQRLEKSREIMQLFFEEKSQRELD